MLQKYDKSKSSLLLAIAAAGGIPFSGTAMAAEAGCSLEDGFQKGLAAYVAEASVCMDEATNFDTGLADNLLSEVNQQRQANGLAPLNRRASLDMAAKAHALDMSVRIFAAHSDLEGRDHLHRIRAFDRTMLVGASGSNVTVSPAAADAASIHASITRDRFSQDNVLRQSFTDVGIGVVEEAGQFYVVQVFAAAEGDLDKALPVSARSGSHSLSAQFQNRDQRVAAWGLVDIQSGETLARSDVPRVRLGNMRGAEAAELNILVADHGNTYVLKGPMVSGQK